MTARNLKRLSGYFYLAEYDPGRCCNAAQIPAASHHTPQPASPPYADVYWWNWGGTVVWRGEISTEWWGTWFSERTLCCFQVWGWPHESDRTEENRITLSSAPAPVVKVHAVHFLFLRERSDVLPSYQQQQQQQSVLFSPEQVSAAQRVAAAALGNVSCIIYLVLREPVRLGFAHVVTAGHS